MRNLIRPAILALALLQAAPAAPADAERVKADYKAEMAKWPLIGKWFEARLWIEARV